MRRRVTVWSVPNDAAGFRLLCEPPITKVSTMDRAGDDVPGTGSITVPSDYEHLSLILDADPSDPDSHQGSLIVVEQDDDDGNGWHPVFEFFADDSKDTLTDQGPMTVISGPEIRSGLDDGTVHPKTDGSPHWQWGAPTLTKNADLSESTIADEEISLWVTTGATGSFTIDVESSGSPATINVGDSASDVKSALEGLSTVTEVRVSGTGTEDDPWHVVFTDPGGTDLFQQTNDSGLTGGESRLRHDVVGGQASPTYYTKSQTYDGDVYGVHGGSSMAVVDDPAAGGGKALKIVGNSAFIGCQQIIDVDVDSDGYASVEIYTTSATDEFRLVLRTVDEGFIASSGGAAGYEGVTVTPNQWNTITISDIDIEPEHGDRLILRFAVVSDGNPDDFYVRNLEYHPGLPGTTAGDISDTLVAAAQTRGTLEWVESDYDASLDSNGDAWDTDDLAFQADAGQHLGTHVVGDLQEGGYEADLVRIPDAELDSGPNPPTHRLRLYNPGGRGPAAGLNTAIVVGAGIVGGTVGKRRVPITHLLVETYDGVYVEVTDARLSGLPRREGFLRAEQARDVATAQKIGEAVLDGQIENLLAAQVRLTGDTVVAYRDFDIGSTVPYTLGRRAARHDRRIHTIALEYDGERWFDTITASKLFAGSGSGDSPLVLEALRKLYATFDRRHSSIRQNGSAAVLPAASQVVSAPTVFVAASDASAASKAKADYVCDGVNDEAILVLARSEAGAGGRILLSEGVFSFSSEYVASSMTLRGLGRGVTTVRAAAGFSGAALFRVTGGDPTVHLSDLTLDCDENVESAVKANSAAQGTYFLRNLNVTDGTGPGLFFQRTQATVYLHRVYSTGSQHGAQIDESTAYIRGCHFDSNSSDGVACSNRPVVYMWDSRAKSNGRYGIQSYGLQGGDAKLTAIGCQFNGNASSGVRWVGGVGVVGERATFVGCEILSNGAAPQTDAGHYIACHIDATPTGSQNTVVHNRGLGSGDHSDLDLADLGSGSALDNQVIAADGAGGAAWEYPDGFDRTAIHDDTAGEINAVTGKTTPVDADELLMEDSAASFGKKKLTWANIKATLKTYFDTLYLTPAHTHSVDDLSDADTTTAAPSSDDLLGWDGTNWVPVTPGAPAQDLRSELLMQDGVTNPPVPVETEAQDDWLYADAL